MSLTKKYLRKQRILFGQTIRVYEFSNGWQLSVACLPEFISVIEKAKFEAIWVKNNRLGDTRFPFQTEEEANLFIHKCAEMCEKLTDKGIKL